jgi:hypothetical protein
MFYRNRYLRRAGAFPHGWACGWAYAGPSRTDDDESGQRSYQESRHFGHRGGSFGARRPLRHLSYRLDLDERQQRVAARVLDKLKVELEQARLDEKKTVSEVADLISGQELVRTDLERALAPRVETARNLQAIVASAMHELAEALDRDQREELSHLLRSGAFRI